ncbi:MAG TPA: cadmium resistance transporter [Pseudonocardiaceae bacterium]
MFAVTNVDDLLLLAIWFGRARGRAAVARVVAGQYLGFAAILAASVAGALGLGLLPPSVVPWLGLLPLALGLRAARQVWRDRATPGDERDDGDDGAGRATGGAPGLLTVAGVTLANGGDNLGVYVPVFTAAGPAAVTVFVVVFLALVGVWCAAGRYLATRPPVARALTRWGHLALPVVLIAIGVLILADGL